jgi:hypothetical protein
MLESMFKNQNRVITTEAIFVMNHVLGEDPLCSSIPYDLVVQERAKKLIPFDAASTNARAMLLTRMTNSRGVVSLPESLRGLPTLKIDDRTLKYVRRERRAAVRHRGNEIDAQYWRTLEEAVKDSSPDLDVSRMWLINKIVNSGYAVMPRVVLLAWFHAAMKDIKNGEHVLKVFSKLQPDIEACIATPIEKCAKTPLLQHSISELVNSDINIHSEDLIREVEKVVDSIEFSSTEVVEAKDLTSSIFNTENTEASEVLTAVADSIPAPSISLDTLLNYRGHLSEEQVAVLERIRALDNLHRSSREDRLFLSVFFRYELVSGGSSVVELAELVGKQPFSVYGVLDPIKRAMGKNFFNLTIPTPIIERKRSQPNRMMDNKPASAETSVTVKERGETTLIRTMATQKHTRVEQSNDAPSTVVESSSKAAEINAALFMPHENTRAQRHDAIPAVHPRNPDMSFPAIYEGMMGKIGMLELFFQRIAGSEKATPQSRALARAKLEKVCRIRQMTLELGI